MAISVCSILHQKSLGFRNECCRNPEHDNNLIVQRVHILVWNGGQATQNLRLGVHGSLVSLRDAYASVPYTIYNSFPLEKAIILSTNDNSIPTNNFWKVKILAFIWHKVEMSILFRFSFGVFCDSNDFGFFVCFFFFNSLLDLSIHEYLTTLLLCLSAKIHQAVFSQILWRINPLGSKKTFIIPLW